MKPSAICSTILGTDKLNAILDEFSSPQIKATLKGGRVRAKLPGGYVSRLKRRRIWGDRVLSALADDNDDLASELLQQWLLNHRRPMLIDLLDRLEVEHRQGETDESFLVAQPKDKVLEAAAWLLEQYDQAETLAYLHYVAHQQHSDLIDEWQEAGGADAAPETGQPEKAPR